MYSLLHHYRNFHGESHKLPLIREKQHISISSSHSHSYAVQCSMTTMSMDFADGVYWTDRFMGDTVVIWMIISIVQKCAAFAFIRKGPTSSSRRYKFDEFAEFAKFLALVPMADGEIIQLQKQGYAYLR